jgi:hypothetical protein
MINAGPVSFILFFFLFGQANSSVENHGINFIHVNRYKQHKEYSIYNDVLSHTKNEPHGDKDGRYTNVHETAHSIHNELRFQYRKLFHNRSFNVLYCLNDKAVIIEDPNIRIRHVQRYIPNILRSSRYKIYLVEQLQYWDETPTYLLDEWNCYILGAECAVDDSNKKIPLEKTNAVSGALEFSIYCTALAMAVQENDPIFWETNTQFKSFIKYSLIRSEKVFGAGSVVPEFHNKEQTRLLNDLLNHPDSGQMRDFLKREFDGIFVE